MEEREEVAAVQRAAVQNLLGHPDGFDELTQPGIASLAQAILAAEEQDGAAEEHTEASAWVASL